MCGEFDVRSDACGGTRHKQRVDSKSVDPEEAAMETILESVVVDVPVRTAYNQWTQFEEFPKFMGGVASVQQVDDTHLYWVAQISGIRREWDTEIVEQIPDEQIAWREPFGDGPSGVVTFDAISPISALSPMCTRVTVEMSYEPEGIIEKLGDKLGIIERKVAGDLERFKEMIESRRVETGAWRGRVELQRASSGGIRGRKDCRALRKTA
jgi:uncharacterized membrane protein